MTTLIRLALLGRGNYIYEDVLLSSGHFLNIAYKFISGKFEVKMIAENIHQSFDVMKSHTKA